MNTRGVSKSEKDISRGFEMFCIAFCCADSCGSNSYSKLDYESRRVVSSIFFDIYDPVIMNVLYKVIGIQPISFNPLISIPIFCIVFILPSHLVVWIMRKIPVIRKLV